MTYLAKISLVVGIMISLLAVTTVFFIVNFSIFGDEAKRLTEITVPGKDYILRIYHIPSNASSHSYIQVRKYGHNVEEVLASYQSYNCLDDYGIIGKNTLVLKISDTIRKSPIRQVIVELP